MIPIEFYASNSLAKKYKQTKIKFKSIKKNPSLPKENDQPKLKKLKKNHHQQQQQQQQQQEEEEEEKYETMFNKFILDDDLTKKVEEKVQSKILNKETVPSKIVNEDEYIMIPKIDEEIYSNIISPLTISLVNNAFIHVKNFTDYFIINGKYIQKINLIGLIIKLQEFKSRTILTIDDGTGCIDIIYYHSAYDTQINLYCGIYISIIAELFLEVGTKNENKKIVNVLKVNKVTDYNQITYHNLNVINLFKV